MYSASVSRVRAPGLLSEEDRSSRSVAPERAREGVQHDAVHRGAQHGGADQDGAGRREPEREGEGVPWDGAGPERQLHP